MERIISFQTGNLQKEIANTQEVKPVGIIRVLCTKGDNKVVWSPDAKEAISEAERIFAEQRQNGAIGFKVAKDKSVERIDEFDPKADEIVMVPRIAGG